MNSAGLLKASLLSSELSTPIKSKNTANRKKGHLPVNCFRWPTTCRFEWITLRECWTAVTIADVSTYFESEEINIWMNSSFTPSILTDILLSQHHQSRSQSSSSPSHLHYMSSCVKKCSKYVFQNINHIHPDYYLIVHLCRFVLVVPSVSWFRAR